MLNPDLLPSPLIESEHTQQASREMPGKNREPDIDRIQRRECLQKETDAERNDDLRNDGDVERTSCIACPLKPTGVRERNSHEQSRKREYMHQLHGNRDNLRIMHAEDVQ